MSLQVSAEVAHRLEEEVVSLRKYIAVLEAALPAEGRTDMDNLSSLFRGAGAIVEVEPSTKTIRTTIVNGVKTHETIDERKPSLIVYFHGMDSYNYEFRFDDDGRLKGFNHRARY